MTLRTNSQVRVLPPRASSAPPVNADKDKSVNRVVDNNRAALNAYKTLPAVSLQPVSQPSQIQGQGHIQIQRPPQQSQKQQHDEQPVQISIREHSDSFSGNNTVMVSAVAQNPTPPLQQRITSKVDFHLLRFSCKLFWRCDLSRL